ncbi:MAG: MFS transporter [Desulfobacterales bacterium]
MGATSFAAALASTFWGSLATRFSPKKLYMRGLLSHALIILLMGYVSSLPVLLVLRIVQGIMGGISTVGLVIVSSSSSREWAARDIGCHDPRTVDRPPYRRAGCHDAGL